MLINNEERIQAMDALKEKQGEDEIWEYLSHPDSYIRILALEKLNQIGTEYSLPRVEIMLNDESIFVREKAADFIVKIGNEHCVHILHRSLKFTQEERPDHLSNALAYLGKPGFEALVDCLKSINPNVRYHACRGLGSTKNLEAKSILEKLAEDDNEKTSFGGLVSTAARKGLQTLIRHREKEN